MRGRAISAGRSQVFEQVEAALAGADQVDVTVAVDVDGGHLKPGPGGPRREVLHRVALGTLGGGVPGRLALEDDVLGPFLRRLVEGVPGDDRAVGRARLNL